MKKKLGVNIDHVATIRNARGENYPSPLKAAMIAEKSKANSVTIHLREDRRHIKDSDLKKIKQNLKIPLNLEIAPTKEMLKIALKNKPNFVCIVPEKRNEVTTEGGLNLNKKKYFLNKMIKKLKMKGIRVSLFIEPKISDIIKSKKLSADCVELHTGKFCNLFNRRLNTKSELIKRFEHLPLHLSITCNAPSNGTHCGKCNKCNERQEAFILADVTDRTYYES